MAESSECGVEWCRLAVGGDGVYCRNHSLFIRRHGRMPRQTIYDPRERLFFRVQRDEATGCWNWTGALKGNGYGVTRYEGRAMVAHRAMWLMERGPITEGLQLDHLCHNRRCVNPDHLEPVTQAENLRRGDGTTATDTHCANGHLWADDNERRHLTDGSKVCATCLRDHAREYQRRKRAARAEHPA